MVNLSELRNTLRRERNSEELVDLQEDFYFNVRTYLDELREELEKEETEEAELMLRDEIESTKNVVKNIFVQRIGKIIRLASLHLEGLDVETDSMVEQEKELFENIRDDIEKGKKIILEDAISEPEKVDSEENFNNSKNPFIVARVKKDFPKFVASNDRIHHFEEEDIVCLPKKDSEILIKRNVIEEI
ncbi:MAG: DNA replication initiation complex subunit GINS15 family [Candidatus Methanohalarchaeum thermophilum]|uniref:DNA replication initiation complex subunit GINS15 family n=1 Tax=Methanohalarchaeum thermophilum TaxID=1903181 RepID=A0A1Q6DW46_METT1|nr:MAG: DNA replication initiation complex subunit GINS15 family [Candidatus Methanohalarchaeum thermophilum]